jgi:hypothetical protein
MNDAIPKVSSDISDGATFHLGRERKNSHDFL